MRLVLPIAESPTMPTLMTTLLHRRLVQSTQQRICAMQKHSLATRQHSDICSYGWRCTYSFWRDCLDHLSPSLQRDPTLWVVIYARPATFLTTSVRVKVGGDGRWMGRLKEQSRRSRTVLFDTEMLRRGGTGSVC